MPVPITVGDMMHGGIVRGTLLLSATTAADLLPIAAVDAAFNIRDEIMIYCLRTMHKLR